MSAKITIKSAAAEAGISPRMLRSISRRVGTWPEYRDRIASEISEHGADTGWRGFAYCRDTMAFASAHAAEIRGMLDAMASDMGQTAPEIVAGCRCLSGIANRDDVAVVLSGGRSDVRDEVCNALAWFALEEASRRIVHLGEG